MVAASVAGITLWPDPTGTWVPAAYAGWRAVPEPVTPGDAQVQASRCRDLARTADPVGNAYGALPVDQLTPVISERRGTWTFTLLVAGARGSHTESALTCLLSDDPRASGNLGGSHGPAASAPEPDQIQWVGADGGGPQFDVWGYTGDDVERVTATLSNGVVVDATVSGGYFAAWWPTSTGGNAVAPSFTLTWYLTDGS